MRLLLRSVHESRLLVLLVVLTRLAATLIFGVAVSRSVAGFIGAHPAGELALLEGGAERLAELAPRIRIHPGWPLASLISYILLLVIPHGALIVRASGAAPSAGAALRIAARRTGLLFFAFVLALLSRLGAAVVAVSSWPRFSGAGSVFLVLTIVLAWALLEGFSSLVRAHALVRGERFGAAFKRSYDLWAMVRAGFYTLVHAVLQCVVAAAGLALSARAAVQPSALAVIFVGLSVVALTLSTSLFAAAQILIVKSLPAEPPTPASNGLPTSDQVGYETAPSVDESPGSSVGRAED